MNIKIGKYRINQSVNSARFDLVEVVKRQKKDKATGKPNGETYEAENNLGYDMRLESCIERIVINKLRENTKTVELKEFLEEYRKEKQEIEKLVKL